MSIADLQTLTLDSLTPDQLPNLSQITSQLTLEQEADLKLAIYHLHRYQPPEDGSNLDRVQGYLEAIHHLGNLSAWQAVAQLMQHPISPSSQPSLPPTPTAPTQPPDCPTDQPPGPIRPASPAATGKPLYEQLGWWGYYHHQRDLCQQVLGQVDAATDCLCLKGLGHAFRQLGLSQQALQFCQQYYDLAVQLGDRPAELIALGDLGATYRQIGQIEVAKDYHQQQLALAQKLLDRRQECLALIDLGQAEEILLRSKKGLSYLHQAERLAQDLEDRELAAHGAERLGQAYLYRGQYQQAIYYLRYCLDLDIDVPQQRIIMLCSLGEAHYMGLQQYAEAERYMKQALALCQERGDRWAEAKVLNSLGVLYTYGLKQPALALPMFQKALRYIKPMQSYHYPVVLANLCASYVYLGDTAQAQHYSQAALLALDPSHPPENRAIVLAVLGNAAWYDGKFLQSLGLLARSLWVIPPWRSVNGQLIVRSLLREVAALWRRWLSRIGNPDSNPPQ